MKNGILEDGSLSSRLKGDLYWKKQKLMLKSEEDSARLHKGTRHFYERFQENGEAQTATVRELSVDPEFKESRVSPLKLAEYSQYIPENYISQIKNGSLKVKAYHKDEVFNGLTIAGVHSGWLELVWVSLAPGMYEEEKALGFISHIIAKAKEENKYKGVFLEMHVVEQTDQMIQICENAGMVINRRKNNLYEFRMSDVIPQDTLFKAVKKYSCVPLFLMMEEQKDEVEKLAYNEQESVPIQLPIPWDKYRQDLSFVHYDSREKSYGIMLVSEVGDTLVFDLLFSKNPLVTAALLGTAIESAGRILAQDQKILVPIVQEATRPLVEKIVPDAQREELVEAYYAF